MKTKIVFFIVALPIVSATSFWDMVPIVSQLKALVQGLSGDLKAGDQTTINFINEGIGPAQFRSVYYLLIGDFDKAIDIQKKFGENLEPLLDSTPGLGHLKGAIHLLVGDDQHGWSALKQATTTTGSVAGAVFGGPLGAVAGHVATDGVISLVDWAINGDQAQPHGLVDYGLTLGKRKAGEHFDALAGIVMNGITGSIQPLKKNDKPSAVTTQNSTVSLAVTQPRLTTTTAVPQPSNNASTVTQPTATTTNVIDKPSNTTSTGTLPSTSTTTVTQPSNIISTVTQPSNTS